MDRAEEYRQRAKEADRLASQAATAAERQTYEKIAQGWRELEVAAQIASGRGV